MSAPAVATPATGTGPGEQQSGFHVRLEQFEGPFDLLLQLISRHRLDVTEVALSRVTDDFLAHLRRDPAQVADLDETTSFLVVAATLLDWKAARLLPQGQVEDEEDLARLEARDVLFARLLQYRAFRQVAALFVSLLAGASRRHARSVPLEPHLAALLPEVQLPSPERLAKLAARALTPRVAPIVSVDHVHAPEVDVAEQADHLRRLLAAEGAGGALSFRALVAGASTLVVVGRFLALLDLYREGDVQLEQSVALAELTVRWEGS